MNADAILIKIEEDARQTAERMLSDAHAKVNALKAASREKIEEMHAAMLQKATADAAELEQRMLRMASLDERKALLVQKRDLIDQAFAKARALLTGADATTRRTFFLSQVVNYANGDEVLFVGETAADWFDDAFLSDANRALAAQGKAGSLSLAPERLPTCEGVVLKARGAETHCTFDAILSDLRPELEQQVAAMLFDVV